MNTKRWSVLFVCTGNICRSPMAAALFRARLQEACDDWQNWQVDSAGTWAADGEPVSKNSYLVMKQRGQDIASHRARTVTDEMLEQYQLILTMEPGHKEAIQIEFPSVANRVYMLSEMEGKRAPVEDPYGGPLEEYEKTARKIDEMIDRGFERIQKLVKGRL